MRRAFLFAVALVVLAAGSVSAEEANGRGTAGAGSDRRAGVGDHHDGGAGLR